MVSPALSNHHALKSAPRWAGHCGNLLTMVQARPNRNLLCYRGPRIDLLVEQTPPAAIGLHIY